MELPIRSLKVAQLTISKQKADDSANNARFSTYEDEKGQLVEGWFKECNKGKYPVFLAKFVVAASVRVRMALGKEAAEEMLVFNEKNQIVGTFSYKVEGFEPLRCWLSLSNKKNPNVQMLQTPELKDLLNYWAAKYIISRWIHIDNDGHPHNWSLKGIIDYDEFFFPLTSIIKYGQPSILALSLKELINLPFVYFRTHWVTQFPLNVFKAFNTDAFKALKGNVEFKQQCYASLLKECLAYDKKVLKDRLHLYLGDLSLDLDKLEPYKKNLLLELDQERIQAHLKEREDEDELNKLSPIDKKAKKQAYADEFSLCYDASHKERLFLDFCIRYFEDEHQKLLDLILHFGEFKEYLAGVNTNPKDMLKIRTWFAENNINNPAPYNLIYIEQVFHIMWRECFQSSFDQCMQDLIHDMQKILPSDEEQYKPENSDVKLSKKILKDLQKVLNEYIDKDVDIHITDNHKFINALKAEINSQIKDCLEKTNSKTLLALKADPTNRKIGYLNKKIGQKEHTQYFMINMVVILKKFKRSIFKVLDEFKLNENLALKITLTTTPRVKEFKVRHFSPDLKLMQSPSLTTTTSITKKVGSLRCLKLPQPTNTVTEAAELLPSEETTLWPNDASYDFMLDAKKITNLETALEVTGYRLQKWLKALKPGDECKIKDLSINEYLTAYAWKRTYKKGDEELSLETLFAKKGSYNTNSLKMFLIKNLCLEMLREQENQDLKKIFSIQPDYDKPIFWCKYAEKIAKQAGLQLEPTTAEYIQAKTGYLSFLRRSS